MNREEILAKSRKTKNDEYERDMIKKSSYVGLFIVIGLCIVFLIINAVVSDIKGLETGINSFDYAAIISGSAAGISFYQFVKIKAKTSLITSLCFAVSCIAMSAIYINNLLGML